MDVATASANALVRRLYSSGAPKSNCLVHSFPRTLLGVKYLLAREDGDSFTDDMGKPKMSGFEFYRHEEGYDVYINTNYVGMGFAYDYYMTEAQADSIPEGNRSNAMLKAIILTDEQVGKYGGLLTNISDYGKQDKTEEFVGNSVESVPLADVLQSAI